MRLSHLRGRARRADEDALLSSAIWWDHSTDQLESPDARRCLW